MWTRPSATAAVALQERQVGQVPHQGLEAPLALRIDEGEAVAGREGQV